MLKSRMKYGFFCCFLVSFFVQPVVAITPYGSTYELINESEYSSKEENDINYVVDGTIKHATIQLKTSTDNYTLTPNASGAVTILGSKYDVSSDNGTDYIGKTTPSVINSDQTVEKNFIGNTRSASGAAVSISAGAVSFKGNFISNSSFVDGNSYGAAIFNDNKGIIGSVLNGDFIDNKVSTEKGNVAGGAIYNYGTISSKITLSGIYSNNQALSNSSVYGGAIYNVCQKMLISESVFSNNIAKSSANNISAEIKGGALYYDGSKLEIEHTSFIGNTIKSATSGEAESDALGGAIYIGNVTNEITINDSYFAYNSAITTKGAETRGGAIYLSENVTNNLVLTDTSFEHNSAKKGAAIYNDSDATITIKADKKDVVFNNMETNVESGIQIKSGKTINFNANAGRTITFKDVVLTNNSDGNHSALFGINTASKNTGTVVFNNTLPNLAEFNLYYGILNLKDDAATSTIKSITTNVTNKATLSIQDDKIGTLNVADLKISGSGTVLNYAFDINLNSGTTDVLNITNASSVMELKISDIQILADGTSTGLHFLTATSDILGNITLDKTSFKVNTENYEYTITPDDSTKSSGYFSLNIVRAEKQYTLPELITDSTKTSFSMTGDLQPKEALGTLAGANRTFTINGNNHTLSGLAENGSTRLAGVVTDSKNQTLTVNSLTVQYYTTFANIKTGDTLNLQDVVFSDNENDIANAGTVNLAGTNSFSSGVMGTGSMTISSGTTNFDSTTGLQQGNLTVSSGATLKINPANLSITNAVSNNGTIDFGYDGTLTQSITGTGTMKVSANLTADADKITQNISTNTGSVNLTGGSLLKTIEGTRVFVK